VEAGFGIGLNVWVETGVRSAFEPRGHAPKNQNEVRWGPFVPDTSKTHVWRTSNDTVSHRVGSSASRQARSGNGSVGLSADAARQEEGLGGLCTGPQSLIKRQEGYWASRGSGRLGFTQVARHPMAEPPAPLALRSGAAGHSLWMHVNKERQDVGEGVHRQSAQ